MVLFIVRRGATDFSGYLHQTFAGQPVYILWDRRVGERRRERSRFVLDRRRDDRRDAASPLSRDSLPLIAVKPARSDEHVRSDRRGDVHGVACGGQPDDLVIEDAGPVRDLLRDALGQRDRPLPPRRSAPA